MAELSPISFSDLVRRMRREVPAAGAIFDLPVKKWFVPDGELDFSAVHFGRRAATPVGPAAGPHTQLAQNIVLAWLAGSRILELKTVQVNDRLEIPRPCIHVPNVGFNVEWSQELRVEQSRLEYAKALYLIEILKATRGFGVFPDAVGFETIYDISVGYDLDGIRSPKVTGFLEALRHPREMFDALRGELTGDLREFRDIELPESISDCVTLSTFHGCPADEIESISRYLIEERGLHTIVKLNPTLLGFETVRELLHDRLGYGYELDRAAFDADLQYDDALAILRRLRGVAAKHGTTIGAKFTNTLVVKNREDFFPTQSDPYMYLSGPPLHVISMTLMQRLRDDLGFELPTSFSAGIDARNFATAVACGMVPITTCTDLLRQGGYGRLPAYLRALAKEMRRLGVTSREAYVLAAGGHAVEAARASVERLPEGAELWRREGAGLKGVDAAELPHRLRALAAAAGHDGDVLVLDATRSAGRLNGRDLVPGLAAEPRYHAHANARTPKRIDSRLELYDCINCDLCIAACPNDAIFAYEARPMAVATEVVRADGHGLARVPGRGFSIAESHQLAVAEAACNECSNCEVYCPEIGAPFVVKEQVFVGREAFEGSRADGFYREGDVLHGRVAGRELRLEPDPERNRAVLGVTDGGASLRLELTWEPLAVIRDLGSEEGAAIDTAIAWRMKTVWESIYHARRPNAVTAGPPVGVERA